MKKVIFICLLTISVCLSDTAGKPASDTKQTGDASAPTSNGNVTPPPTPQNPPADHKETKPATPDQNTTQTNHTAPPASGTTTNGTSATTDNSTAKTDNATTPAKPTDKPTDKPASNTTPVKPDDKPASNTTEKPVNPPKPTPTTEKVPTQPADTTPKPLQARGFDGASFVGGIILTLGLLAIGFMGFKYYKAQTERNYHTL